MFNNGINKKAQLIATLHDVSLLDCKRMFRKEQIWFTDKDENGTDLYSLKEFSYAESGIRETTDLQDRYRKGAFGVNSDSSFTGPYVSDTFSCLSIIHCL